nr:formin-like protein 5 [Aegilops tauschii subsp. strangulata]
MAMGVKTNMCVLLSLEARNTADDPKLSICTTLATPPATRPRACTTSPLAAAAAASLARLPPGPSPPWPCPACAILALAAARPPSPTPSPPRRARALLPCPQQFAAALQPCPRCSPPPPLAHACGRARPPTRSCHVRVFVPACHRCSQPQPRALARSRTCAELARPLCPSAPQARRPRRRAPPLLRARRRHVVPSAERAPAASCQPPSCSPSSRRPWRECHRAACFSAPATASWWCVCVVGQGEKRR